MRPAILLALALAACAPATRQVVRPAVESGISEATGRDSAKELDQLLSSPEIRHSAEELTEAVVAGMRNGLSDPELQAAIDDRAARLVDAVAAALARDLEIHLGPAARRELALAVRRAAEQLSSPDTQATIREIARSLTTATAPAVRDTTDDVMLGIGDALNGDLGVSLHAFLAEERAATFEDTGHAMRPLEVATAVTASVAVPALVVMSILFAHRRRAEARNDLAARLLARVADSDALARLVERVQIEGDAELARYLGGVTALPAHRYPRLPGVEDHDEDRPHH